MTGRSRVRYSEPRLQSAAQEGRLSLPCSHGPQFGWRSHVDCDVARVDCGCAPLPCRFPSHCKWSIMASSSSSPSPSAPNDTATASSILQFSPLPTQISADFWHALSTLKLDRLRLNEAPLPLRGEYGVARRVKDRKTGGVVAVQGTLALAEGSLEAVDARGQAG